MSVTTQVEKMTPASSGNSQNIQSEPELQIAMPLREQLQLASHLMEKQTTLPVGAELAFVQSIASATVKQEYLAGYLSVEPQRADLVWSIHLRNLVSYFNLDRNNIQNDNVLARGMTATGLLFWYMLELPREQQLGVDTPPFLDVAGSSSWRDLPKLRDEIINVFTGELLALAQSCLDDPETIETVVKSQMGNELHVYPLVIAMCFLKVKPIMEALAQHVQS